MLVAAYAATPYMPSESEACAGALLFILYSGIQIEGRNFCADSDACAAKCEETGGIGELWGGVR